MTRTILLSLAAASLALAAEPVRIDISRDVWISSYPTEVEGNNGASPKLKFKGVQELALMDIDITALKGKRVTKAQLHLHGEGDAVLRRMTVSTVMSEWVEGDGTSYKKVPGASSFTWARNGEQRWGGNEPDITGVINGLGGSRWCFADPTPRDANRWQILPVDPALVQERLDGRCFGFAVMDDVGIEYTRDGSVFTNHGFINRYVSSKDDKRSTKPYFLLWLEDGAASAPVSKPVEAVAVKPAVLPPIPATPSATALAIECRDEFNEPLASLDFFAAKGKTISFIVAASARIELTGVNTRTYAMPLVEGHQDPLTPGSSDGATCIELLVPKTAIAGKITGKVVVGSQTLPCSLTIWNFTLPDHLSFIPQMNCYSLPGHELAYYRLAHEHRLTLNCLPYHWNGKIDAGPEIKPDGTWDWTKWDAQYAPLFDGSAFKDLPRSGVPIEAFYLMLNENWPMDHEKHFKGGYWIESAYDNAYWQQFREAVSRTAKHLGDKGWSDTMFEFYLNNKVSFKAKGWERSTAAWVFDEPSNTQDFWALRRFGIEFWTAAAAHPNARLVYRADISRPQWQRDILDGLVNVEVVSGSLRTYSRHITTRAQKFGNLVYMYGSANALGTPRVSNAAWCVEAWALGADGVVPWQTVGNPKSWEKADELSLFYPTASGPVPSLRLKTFRAGQQLVEYLTLFTALSGESRQGVASAVLNEPGLQAKTVKKNEDDAGKSAFGADTHRALTALRLRLGQWLNDKAPAPRERWHDPRPKAQDASAVPEIKVVPP